MAGMSPAEAERFAEQARRLDPSPAVACALAIAEQAHAGQVDRSGVAYIFHPLHLALAAATDDERCVALLHDVLEDTAVTAAQLVGAGVSSRLVRAVEALSRHPDEDYPAFIERVCRDRLASRVKLLDLAHNSDLSRLPGEPTAQDLARLQKYQAAAARLRAELVKRNLYVSLDASSRAKAKQGARLPLARAEHITLAHRVTPTADLLPYLDGEHELGDALELRAVAECVSERVQTWVIELGGSSRRKHDGGTLHLTVSHGPDARSRESNDLLQSGTRTPIAEQLFGTLEWVDE
jgi:hypothetical protein